MTTPLSRSVNPSITHRPGIMQHLPFSDRLISPGRRPQVVSTLWRVLEFPSFSRMTTHSLTHKLAYLLELPLLLTIVNNVDVNTDLHVSVSLCQFFFFIHKLREGIAGLHCFPAFHCGGTTGPCSHCLLFHIPMSRPERVPFSLPACQLLLFCGVFSCCFLASCMRF